MALLLWLTLGTVVGIAGWATTRERGDFGFAVTMSVGLLGAFVGGTFGNVLANEGLALAVNGGIGAFLGAVLLLVTYDAAGTSATSAATQKS